MKVWFTADTHFCHAKLIKLAASRAHFKDCQTMDDLLITRWNERIEPSDHVYHLGDFALAGAPWIARVASQLNGKMFLLKGNHDHQVPKRTRYYHVDLRPSLTEQKIEGQHISMCHYPMIVWNHSRRGSWMLHGHCHGNLKEGRTCLKCGYCNDDRVKRLDVGVDAHDFYPWSFDEVSEYMSTRGIPDVDHHRSSSDAG